MSSIRPAVSHRGGARRSPGHSSSRAGVSITSTGDWTRAMSRMVRSVDLEALYDIFDVPEEAGPGALVAGARRQHPTLPHLILSAAEHCGTPMSDAALGELRRAQRRARLYRD